MMNLAHVLSKYRLDDWNTFSVIDFIANNIPRLVSRILSNPYEIDIEAERWETPKSAEKLLE
jgi:hypothetical protein